MCVYIYIMEELSSSRKRVRDELEDSRFDSPEVKRIKEDLLENFDDTDFFTASHELDSFMKSFEKEISSSGSTLAEESAAATASAAVVDLTSESGDSQPELGYLLEASDDELGIPPSTSDVEKDESVSRVPTNSAELSNELWRYDEGIPNFDSFEFGIGDGGSYYNNNNNTLGGGEYVALDGLFDYSDVGFGSSDYLWRPEMLPAN